MNAINRLFFNGFIVTACGACAMLPGPASTPAPVVTATVSRVPQSPMEAKAVVTPREPASCCETASATVPLMEPRDSGHGATNRSPDALFTAMAALGIDYRWGGRSPATGFDCSGLVAHIYHDAYGLKIPAHTTAQSRLGKPVDLAQMETGDLVFYNTRGQPNTHVGIYIGDERFIHAPRTGAAVRIESMRSNYWKSRFNGARRIVF